MHIALYCIHRTRIESVKILNLAYGEIKFIVPQPF
jgi:hypothetical protein